ncbi:MAG: sigma-54-dependent Fis family transcriptional regulator [Acidobacteria bacterium]|nr:sigma-54-dependent Fis family transcriptional regulator [Acidobacteriota bacterium]
MFRKKTSTLEDIPKSETYLVHDISPDNWPAFWSHQRHPHFARIYRQQSQPLGTLWERENLSPFPTWNELNPKAQKQETLLQMLNALLSIGVYLEDLGLQVPLHPDLFVFHPTRGLVCKGQENWFPGCALHMAWDSRFAPPEWRKEKRWTDCSRTYQVASLFLNFLTGQAHLPETTLRLPKLKREWEVWLRNAMAPEAQRWNLDQAVREFARLAGPRESFQNSWLAFRPLPHWFEAALPFAWVEEGFQLVLQEAPPGKEVVPAFSLIKKEADLCQFLTIHIWNNETPCQPYALINRLMEEVQRLVPDLNHGEPARLMAWHDPTGPVAEWSNKLIRLMSQMANQYKGIVFLIEDFETVHENDLEAFKVLINQLGDPPCLMVLRGTHFHSPAMRRAAESYAKGPYFWKTDLQKANEMRWSKEYFGQTEAQIENASFAWSDFCGEERLILSCLQLAFQGLSKRAFKLCFPDMQLDAALDRLMQWQILESQNQTFHFKDRFLSDQVAGLLSDQERQVLARTLQSGVVSAPGNLGQRAWFAYLAGDEKQFEEDQTKIIELTLATWDLRCLFETADAFASIEENPFQVWVDLLNGKKPTGADLPYWMVQWGQANQWAALGRHQKARRIYALLAKQKADNHHLFHHLWSRAACMAVSTQDKLTLKALKRVLQYQPTYAGEPHYWLVTPWLGEKLDVRHPLTAFYLAYTEGQYEKVLDLNRQFAKNEVIRPLLDQGNYWCLLGRSHEAMGNYNASRKALSKGQACFETIHPQHYKLGELGEDLIRVQAKIGNVKDAQTDWERLKNKLEAQGITPSTGGMILQARLTLLQYDKGSFSAMMSELKGKHLQKEDHLEYARLVIWSAQWQSPEDLDQALNQFLPLVQRKPSENDLFALSWAHLHLNRTIQLPEGPQQSWRFRFLADLCGMHVGGPMDPLESIGSGLERAEHFFLLRCAIEKGWFRPIWNEALLEAFRLHSQNMGRPWLRFVDQQMANTHASSEYAEKPEWFRFLSQSDWSDRNPDSWRERALIWFSRRWPFDRRFSVVVGDTPRWRPSPERMERAALNREIAAWEPAVSKGPITSRLSLNGQSHDCMILPYFETFDGVHCEVFLRNGMGGPQFRQSQELLAIAKWLEFAALLEHERKAPLRAVAPAELDMGMIGRSDLLQNLKNSIVQFASSNMNLHIFGESGAGKELVAKAIHEHSLRSSGPFVAVNCACLPEGLIESHFFGHVRGSFTSAHNDRAGILESADGGTLFLDEVADLDFKTQTMLLRVLQEGEFNRVGDPRTRKVDIRVISATHQDLRVWVEEKRFRHDFFYRLAPHTLEVPPLRHRFEDLHLLIAHQAQKLFPHRNLFFSRSFLAGLKEYAWPGNIRELGSYIERVLNIYSDVKLFDDTHLLPFTHARSGRFAGGDDHSLKQAMDQFKAKVIQERLRKMGGNVTQAAKSLNVTRQCLSKIIHEWGLRE